MILSARVIGALILLCASLFVGRAYEKHLDGRLGEAREVLRLLLHIREKISSFLCPQGELMSDFKSEILESVGFIGKIRDGKGLYDAFRDTNFSFSEDIIEILRSYFSEFGKRYKSDELARLDSAVRSLEGYVKSEEEKLPKDVKIAKILLFAAALGISILMI